MSRPPSGLQHALAVLEFDRVRESFASFCESDAAAKRALEVMPSFRSQGVERLRRETNEADLLLGKESVPSLSAIRDLAPAVRRAAKGGVLGAVEVASIGLALGAMRRLRVVVRAHQEHVPTLATICEPLPDLPKLETKIADSIDPDGEVLDSASTELARARSTKKVLSARLVERIQSYTSGAKREYLSDPIYTQRDGRYVVPVKSEHRSKIRGIVHDSSASGQTVFIEPDDVVQVGNSLREAEAAERAEIERILRNLSERIGAEGTTIGTGLEIATDVDLMLARARFGHAIDGVLPRLVAGHGIRLTSARHPLLDRSIAIPLNIDLGFESDGILITGPNTGGKTVSIKTVGLLAVMAQCGMMVPATEMMLGPFSQLWADIGDEQSLAQSLSTFSGHVKNIAQALRELESGALVLLDEVGAGTDPAEGAALAKAILLELQIRGAKTLASTHYGELKLFAYNTPGFANAAMEFDLKSLRPTYRLLLGAPGASRALEIAARCGIPGDVIERAKSVAGVEEREVAEMLMRLETSQKQAQRAQSDADRLSARLRQVEAEAERKLREAEEAKRLAKKKAADSLEDTLRGIRMEASRIFDDLKRDRSSENIERSREKLKKLQDRGQKRAHGLKPREESAPAAAVEKGSPVRVRGYSQQGTVVEAPRDGKALVQVGMIKMAFPLTMLELVEVPVPQMPGKSSNKSGIKLQKQQSSSMEIVLVNARAEDAIERLVKFLDDAVLAGMPSVRIVHGKGEGILRKITREQLKGHNGVRSYRDGEPGEGGSGVTIAVLE